MVNILRFKQLLLMATLLLSSISTFAYDIGVDGIYYNILTDSTVEVTQYSIYSGNVVIPSTVSYKGKTFTVTSIGHHAFAECTALTSIKIPDGVTSIGDHAFYYCSGLTSANIPNGVKEIGAFAFRRCRNLESIDIPDGVISIKESAFLECSGLTSVSMGKNITSIEEYAFSDCKGLQSIEMPDNVVEIGDYAFRQCTRLNSVKLSENLTSIGNGVFLNCKSMSTIKLPESITSIGYSAFENCSSLSAINIPLSVISIGYSAFDGCRNIKEINISSVEKWMGLTSNNDRWGLSKYSLIVNGLKLTDLAVPESITTIEKYTFYGCTGLESITFHKGVTTVAQNSFNGCTNVKKIVCQGDTPPACGADALTGISRTDCALYVPETSGSNYQNTTPWSEFTNIVGGVTPKTCEAPTIIFDNDAKKLVFTSATEGATYSYTVTSDDMASEAKSTGEAVMTGVYNITAYTSADGMYNSEKTTAKLCWVSASLEGDGILTAKADRGVVVSSNTNQINISGTINGETIEVYNVGGSKLKSINATGDNTTINGLQSGSVYIVKIGGTKVKVAM